MNSDQSVVSNPALAFTSLIANHFTLLQPEWVQLTPYGDFPHRNGLQRINPASAERMVQRFRSFVAKLGRAFGGLPFFIGHPDAPGKAEQFPDRKAYGWIMDIEARADGLYARAKWSEQGRELLRNAHYKYVSPFWEAEEIAPGVYTPVRLISAGLTNQPNLPVLPLSNAAPMGEPATEQPSIANGPAILSLLDNSILTGRIHPCDRAIWNAKLALDFETHSRALLNLKAPTPPQTLGMRKRKTEIAAFSDRQQQIQAHIREQMQRGLDYDAAWQYVKREHPILFPGLPAD